MKHYQICHMEKRILSYEDVYPMLYLKYRLCGATQHKNVKHLVIDEMQDYSYLQYSILGHVIPVQNDDPRRPHADNG